MSYTNEDELFRYFHSQLQKKLGVKIFKQLGEGVFGSAYSLKDGRVLKITRDFSEVATNSKLLGKNLKNVYKVFKIYHLYVKSKYRPILYRYSDDADEDSKNLYILITEKLYNLNTSIYDYISDNSLDIYDFDLEHLDNKIISFKNKNLTLFKKFNKFCFEHGIDKQFLSPNSLAPLFKALSEQPFSVDVFDINKFIPFFLNQDDFDIKEINQLSKLYKDISNGINELKKNGIDFEDFHEGNLMKDKGGNYKIIDIGCTAVNDIKYSKILKNIKI